MAYKPSPDAIRADEISAYYPKYLWYCVACYIAAVSLVNWSAWALRKLSGAPNSSDTEAAASQKRMGLARLPDALVNTYRIVAFRWTLYIGHSYSINVADLTTLFAYWIMVFGLTFIQTTDLKGNMLSETYWGNRAGALAAIQFPLVTALATKNNIIGWITGLSSEKLSFLHRMVARTMLILIWLHAGPKIQRGMFSRPHKEAFDWGLVATVMFTLLVVISVRPIRAKVYEFFFYMHTTLILIILVLSYMHADSAHVGVYVWPALLIWALDRFSRFLRLVLFNHSYFGFGSGKTMDAKLELQSEHFVRVSLRRPAHFHWAPGQTAYLIMPAVSTIPFEAHPFTIASHDSSYDGPQGVDSEKDMGDSADQFWKELVFLINVRTGFTKNLAKIAQQNGTVKAFIDGPYGQTPESQALDSAVLVAGGSGVSYTLPVLLEIIENVRLRRSECKKIVFIWSLRQASHIRWISDALNKALSRCPQSLEIDVQVYITGAGDAAWEDIDSVNESQSAESLPCTEKPSIPSRPSLTADPRFKVVEGRPDIQTILHDEAERTSGRLSVAVCGSQSIASSVRSALGFSVAGPSSILRGNANVTLHVESFGYA